MKESVTIAKEANRKQGYSPNKSDNNIQRLRNGPERQLGSLPSVVGNIRRNGGVPSVENIATELVVMPSFDRASALLALQQTHGNRYVQRVVTGIQAKLKIGQPGDIYEQEADRVAEQVMRMPEPQVQRQVEPEEEEEKKEELIETKTLSDQITPLVQRQVEEEEEEEALQTKEVLCKTPEVTADFKTRIHALKGRGQPLPKSVRNFFEPRFGNDFSRVRVHSDAQTAETAQTLKARAFTAGQDVVFGTGQYTPGTQEGQRLLAHELTHVVQQEGVKVGYIQKQKLAPFKDIEIKPLKTLYNATNRVGKSCIGILNNAVRIIYKKELTKTPKLGSTIQDTMKVLERLNLVDRPTVIEFLDSRGVITTGTKEPAKLSQSVEDQLMSLSAPLNGWYLYGLSIMDGYHSVLIAVHVTDEKKKLYWLDQTVGFKEMTGKLDSEIEKKTIIWWKGVKASKKVGYKTRTTFWPFVRVLGDFPMPSVVYA